MSCSKEWSKKVLLTGLGFQRTRRQLPCMCNCVHGCLLCSHSPTRQPELVISSSLCVPHPNPNSPGSFKEPSHPNRAKVKQEVAWKMSLLFYGIGMWWLKAQIWGEGAQSSGDSHCWQPMLPTSAAQFPGRESELLYQEQVVSNVMTLLSLLEPAETLWQWDYF